MQTLVTAGVDVQTDQLDVGLVVWRRNRRGWISPGALAVLRSVRAELRTPPPSPPAPAR